MHYRGSCRIANSALYKQRVVMNMEIINIYAVSGHFSIVLADLLCSPLITVREVPTSLSDFS